uniref:Uncharacterized protein n=1 Tax=Zea mays TaxID=4577 RepID=A0A804RMV9_MAIZE
MRGGSAAGNPDGTSSPSSSFFQGLSREIPGAPVEPGQEVQQPEMALAAPNPSIQPTDRESRAVECSAWAGPARGQQCTFKAAYRARYQDYGTVIRY